MTLVCSEDARATLRRWEEVRKDSKDRELRLKDTNLALVQYRTEALPNGFGIKVADWLTL